MQSYDLDGPLLGKQPWVMCNYHMGICFVFLLIDTSMKTHMMSNDELQVSDIGINCNLNINKIFINYSSISYIQVLHIIVLMLFGNVEYVSYARLIVSWTILNAFSWFATFPLDSNLRYLPEDAMYAIVYSGYSLAPNIHHTALRTMMTRINGMS